MQMGICGRCTSCSHWVSRDAQNMSSKLTNQAGKGNISLFGCVVLQAHPSNCAARAGSQAFHQLFFPAAAQQPEIGAAFTCQLSSNLLRLASFILFFQNVLEEISSFPFYLCWVFFKGWCKIFHNVCMLWDVVWLPGVVMLQLVNGLCFVWPSDR